MKKIENTEMAIKMFRESAIQHGEATLTGDYKIGNKYHDIIQKCLLYLKKEDNIVSLQSMLSDPNISVRCWTAYALLPIFPNESKAVLSEISCRQNILGLNAKMILQEWEKRKLNIPLEETLKDGDKLYSHETEKYKKSKKKVFNIEEKPSEGSNNAGGTEITEDLSQDISRLSSIFNCPQDDDKQSGYSVFIDTERQEIIVHVNTFVNPYSQDIETVYQRWVKRFRAFEHVATVSPYKPSKLGFMQIVLSIPLDKGTDEVLTQLYEVIQSICNEWKPNERKVCFKADYKGLVCYFEGAWWYPYRAIIKDGGKYKRYDFSDEMKFDEKMWDIVKGDYDDLENTESFALIDAKEFEDIWKKTSFFHKIIPW